MIKHNKYWKIYNQIIDKALSEKRTKGNTYYENHHIVPRSIRPDLEKDKNNQVLLTAREHYICHYLLTKFTEGENTKSMIYAFHRMNHSTNFEIILNSLLYEKNRIKMSEMSKGKGNPNYEVPMTEENKKKLREMKLGSKLSEDTKKKISESLLKSPPMLGKKHSNKTKEKIRKSREKYVGENHPLYGTPVGEERKEKQIKTLKETLKNNPDIIKNMVKNLLSEKDIVCPHCGFKSKSKGNMKRWHFKNCKNKD